MTPTTGGRFCDGCQKPVIDFTTWREEELQAWFRTGARGCGRFEVQQLDPSLVPIDQIGRSLQRGLFATAAAFVIGNSQAQTIDPIAPTEQVDSSFNSNGHGVNARLAVEARNPKLTRETCPPIAPPPIRVFKKRTYLSWRFPFVHRTIPHRTGFF
jgi:hypothetical protein